MLSQSTASDPLPRTLDAAWDTAIGLATNLLPRTRRFLAQADAVLAMEKQFADLTDAKLGEQAQRHRELFRRNRQKKSDLLAAFAVVREVAFRHLGERPYRVQVAGALAIEAGCIAEMATGEGKTLTATMPATIAGWRGRGCHVLTVNDYLAKRDAEWMNKVYRFCGLRAAYIEGEMENDARRDAYGADITYCTNKEVTADFLRDRLALGKLRGLTDALLAKIVEGSGRGTDRLLQTGLACAIIDEADSVLIDEAVTPLIISGEAPNQDQVAAFSQAVALARQLDAEKHYRINERYREVDITDDGQERLDELGRGLGGIWTGRRRREELVVQALTAEIFYRRDKQYVVDDGKVVIVDESTGRLMPDREWRDGLHQAVQAKEGLEVLAPKDTYARISFQRFFRQYKKLSGMTGTAAEASLEFWQIYHLPVAVIPTNRPCVRKVAPDRVFAAETAKWAAVVERIKAIHAGSAPILIGTRSVRASEQLSAMLTAQGLEHQVLNAVRHAEEAQIVAGAGAPGRITVATNMAGRGTDIKLGRGVTELGGLHVIATERHESRRVDRQLIGRCARQGDPGCAEIFVSLEDELVRRHAPTTSAILRTRHATRTAKVASIPEVSSCITRRIFSSAQRTANRQALSQRKGVLKTDDWLDEYLGFAGATGN
ncbi:MAG: hypothetical protein LLG01_10255 [Planctomycetaceae bacterium]|nr:hypothetical protein [Planctomycetaceae bacterium]